MIYHRNFDKTRRVPSIEQKIPTLLDDLCSTPISCVFVLNNPYFSGFVPSFCRGIFCHTRLLIIYIFNLSICDIRLLIIYFLSFCDIRLLIIYIFNLSFCDVRLLIIYFLSFCDIRLLIIYFLSFCDIRLLIIYFPSFCDIRLLIIYIFRHVLHE